jgi:hypothetical protein
MEEWLQWDVIGSSDQQWIDINGVSTSKKSVEYGGMMRIMIKLFMVRVVYVIPNVFSPPARWTKVQIRSSSLPFISSPFPLCDDPISRAQEAVESTPNSC